ncbi:MAG TPA: hypothetical protein VD815_01215 [Candidatus Saccharimonadales bacterium]|nr:hypothetical protein [Candidatus Saccharimonadales bacterium]
MMKSYLLLCMISISITSILYSNSAFVSTVYSQAGEGLEITPSIQWSDNVEGVFSYCVYEGTVTLDSINDPQAFCIIPTSDTPFENMQSFVDDGIDTYTMEQIETPAGLFKDGAPYSVCVTFSPFSPQDSGFNLVESCQQFTNKKGDNPEEPFINLDEGVFSTNQ